MSEGQFDNCEMEAGVSIEEICRVLNEAYSMDPVAIHTLVNHSAVPVNSELADHPTIQVRAAPVPSPVVQCVVGFLGLLNGCIMSSGKLIASTWEEAPGANGAQVFTGFKVMDKSEITWIGGDVE